MATQLQLRRGNTAQTAVFTGAIAEITVDTDQKTVVVHDGTTIGGTYIVTKAQLDSNVSILQGVNDTQNTNITAVNGFAAGAFNTANGANGLAASAFNLANTNAGAITTIQGVDLTQNAAITIIQGVNLTQNTRIDGLEGVDLSQNSAISIIQGVDNTQNANITAVNQYAASGYALANTNATNISIINGVDVTQNTRLNSIETVNIDQNTSIGIIQGVNETQNTNITAVNNYAASAFNKANTGGTFTDNVIIQQNLTVNKNLVVTGNLIVSGNSTSVGANTLVIDDPMIVLANNNTLDVVDIGFIGHYGEISPGENYHTGFVRHAENNEYYIFYNYNKHIHANNNVIDITDSSFRKSNVNADYYKGNLIATTAVIGGTDFTNYVLVTQGVDNTQNTRLNSIETVNIDQNTAIGIIQGVNETQNTNITAVNNFAAGAFNTANGANGLAQGAYNAANTNAINISIIQGVDNTQNTNITAVNNYAVSAFNKANTGGTFTGNVIIQQNLTVANNISSNSYSINGSQYIGINRAITNYGVTHNVLGSGSGNRTIDLTLGNFVSATVTGTTTWTFSNPVASPDATGFVLELTNGGSATQNWPTPAVKWPGGTAPTLTASGVDILTFVTDDGGTTWRGVVSMLDSK